MNGKYYGKREIRWHSREKDRLERIEKERVSKNEKNQGLNFKKCTKTERRKSVDVQNGESVIRYKRSSQRIIR